MNSSFSRDRTYKARRDFDPNMFFPGDKPRNIVIAAALNDDELWLPLSLVDTVVGVAVVLVLAVPGGCGLKGDFVPAALPESLLENGFQDLSVSTTSAPVDMDRRINSTRSSLRGRGIELSIDGDAGGSARQAHPR